MDRITITVSDLTQVSDGYHTIDELYEHRCLLFIAWMVHGKPGETYWVKEHYEGWDLIVCNLESGQISYHINSKFRSLYEGALEEKQLDQHTYDGHTPQDVLRRIREVLSK